MDSILWEYRNQYFSVAHDGIEKLVNIVSCRSYDHGIKRFVRVKFGETENGKLYNGHFLLLRELFIVQPRSFIDSSWENHCSVQFLDLDHSSANQASSGKLDEAWFVFLCFCKATPTIPASCF